MTDTSNAKTVKKETTKNDVLLTDAELMRYARQVLLEGWDIDAQQRLKGSQVIIVGAGGLGCPASETLARAGVGHIHLIDNDVIEESNLQRQSLFTSSDIGKLKAETAANALQYINEFIDVSYSTKRLTNKTVTEGNGSIASLLSGLGLKAKPSAVDSILLVDCTDNFAIRLLLNRLSVQYRLPLLSAAAIGMAGQLALYEPYKQTGCYYCVFGDTIPDSIKNDTNSEDDTKKHTNSENGINSKDDNSTQVKDSNTRVQATCANSGVLASTTMVMGNLQSNAALQYLGLQNNPLAGKVMLWDGKQMTQSTMRYKQDKNCPLCANSQ